MAVSPHTLGKRTVSKGAVITGLESHHKMVAGRGAVDAVMNDSNDSLLLLGKRKRTQTNFRELADTGRWSLSERYQNICCCCFLALLRT